MRYSLGLLSLAVVFTAFVAAPAHIHGQAPAAQAQEPHDHDHPGAADVKAATTPEQRQGMMMNMMADMQAADAKLNALVQTMNAKEHGAMHSSMMNMMGMMGRHDE